jgi:molybdate/tungstate transport system substrate-binding protein
MPRPSILIGFRRWLGSWRLAGAGLAGVLVIVGAMTAVGGSPAASSTKHAGVVDVLYAGSFLDLMQQAISPAFHQATGYTVSGFSNGSTALASEIKGRTQVADVFISASPAADVSLAGAKNGTWVATYDEFGRSPLVLGYDPSSKFAHDLKVKPWYNIVDLPGFRLGRTDPATDPKGVLAVNALDAAAKKFRVPALKALVASTSNVFPETTLIGRLQAGQLDAGFFYAVEASAARITTVPLTGTDLAGKYTVAVVNRAPHKAAARAFVRFLLSAKGRSLLERHGVTPITPPKVIANVG